jgi:hypothetical protein
METEFIIKQRFLNPHYCTKAWDRKHKVGPNINWESHQISAMLAQVIKFSEALERIEKKLSDLVE